MLTGIPLPIRPALLTLLLVFATSPAHAGYKCWTNSDGVRECGQNVPPEYSQQRIEILNDRGVVIDVEEPAKTPEQLEAEKRAEKQRQREERRQAEQKRQDRILLDTFTNERDLKLYYQDKIDAIQSLVDITRASNQTLEDKLGDLQKRAANQERRGQALSDDLLNEMEQVKRRMAHNDTLIAEKQQELKAMNQQFKAELERFRELKSAHSR